MSIKMKASILSLQIKKFAKQAGADLVGIAPAEFDKEGEKHLRKFIKNGRQGNMAYLEEYKKRVDPESLLNGAKSVIVIAVNYYRETPEPKDGEGIIARYAYGRDYHKVIKKLLKNIAEFIEDLEESAETKTCVDTSPLLEKGYAVKAGLGFIGKNTTLITPQYGSFVLLGEIITNLELKYDEEHKGTCGTCTRCLDACPMKAFVGPRELNANRCISYLTIEHKGEIQEELHKPIGKRIFGCDACQDVCPYNKAHAKNAANADLQEKRAGSSIDIGEILEMQTDEQFLERFAGSPLMRAKRQGLQRNARIVKENL